MIWGLQQQKVKTSRSVTLWPEENLKLPHSTCLWCKQDYGFVQIYIFLEKYKELCDAVECDDILNPICLISVFVIQLHKKMQVKL